MSLLALLGERDVRRVHCMDSDAGLSASCVRESLLDELSRLAQGARRPHTPSVELGARHSNRTYAAGFFCTGVMDEFWALTKEE